MHLAEKLTAHPYTRYAVNLCTWDILKLTKYVSLIIHALTAAVATNLQPSAYETTFTARRQAIACFLPTLLLS